jgi:hypothetical protein
MTLHTARGHHPLGLGSSNTGNSVQCLVNEFYCTGGLLQRSGSASNCAALKRLADHHCGPPARTTIADCRPEHCRGSRQGGSSSGIKLVHWLAWTYFEAAPRGISESAVSARPLLPGC